MRDEWIKEFDHVAEETEKMMELCATAQEAAAHAAKVPKDAQNMKALILQAVERLGNKAADVFSHWEEFQTVTLNHSGALNRVSAEELPQKFREWYEDFLSLMIVQLFFDKLKSCLQISAAAAERTEALAQSGLPITSQSRGVLLFETALRCGITAPDLSARIMLQAFEMTPDLLKNSNLDYLNGFVYEPDKHPQAEFTRCPACGGEGAPYRTACSCYIGSYESMFLPAKLWMRCPDCGSLYTRWFPKEFLTLGQEPYMVYPREEWMAVQGANSLILRSWNNILNDVRSLLPEANRLLEVGVGNGSLIAVAQEMGYQVTAVEILEDVAQETADLLNCPILCGDFLKVSENEQFDIITMGDVIEHLQRPAEGLKKAHNLLRDGGVLWISTPNYESAFSRLRKTEDPMWREPYHITYFSRESLTRLLEQTGFEILRYSVSEHYNGSMEMLCRKK